MWRRSCWLAEMREGSTCGWAAPALRRHKVTVALGPAVFQQSEACGRCHVCVCLFILELILSFPNFCLFSFSDRNSGFKAKEDCGNSDSNVLHPWDHNSPWNRLLYSQLARNPASHNAAQLSLPPLLLVM